VTSCIYQVLPEESCEYSSVKIDARSVCISVWQHSHNPSGVSVSFSIFSLSSIEGIEAPPFLADCCRRQYVSSDVDLEETERRINQLNQRVDDLLDRMNQFYETMYHATLNRMRRRERRRSSLILQAPWEWVCLAAPSRRRLVGPLILWKGLMDGWMDGWMIESFFV
jgi:hypothetical protein